MSNRNEIIERLEKLAEHAVHRAGVMPYAMSLDDGIALHEAIDLLKAQEPIAPIQGADDQDEEIFCCGSCGAVVGETFLGPPGECEVRHNYCPNCGRAVRWT